jgi:hypothetical protein
MGRMITEGAAMSQRSRQTGSRDWPEAPDFEGELDRLVELYRGCL